jgi:hypothetical protein
VILQTCKNIAGFFILRIFSRFEKLKSETKLCIAIQIGVYKKFYIAYKQVVQHITKKFKLRI